MSGAPSETLDKLMNLLGAETAALKGGHPLDLHATADAKARLLLELTRKRDEAQGALSPADVLRLTQALAENAQTLKRHMDAVNAIAGSLAEAMRKMDDDGTYGVGGASRRARA